MVSLSKGTFKLPKCVLKRKAPRMSLPRIIRSEQEKAHSHGANTRKKVHLYDGPFDGEVIYLYDQRTGTIPFSINGQYGRYLPKGNKSGLWWRPLT